jgi:hypothetical protein
MTAISRIESRWKIALPQAYLNALSAGILDRLVFSVVKEWVDLASLEGMVIPDDWLPGFVPFAASPAGDYWCWCMPWNTPDGVATVYVQYDSYDAQGFAPSFEASLFRFVVEEMAWSVLPDKVGCSPRALGEVLRGYAHLLAPLLPARLGNVLIDLTARLDTPQETGDREFVFIGPDEAKLVIAQHLAFEHLHSATRYRR